LITAKFLRKSYNAHKKPTVTNVVTVGRQTSARRWAYLILGFGRGSGCDIGDQPARIGHDINAAIVSDSALK